MSVVRLTLSEDQLLRAREVGMERHGMNRGLGVAESHGYSGDDGEVSVRGCMAGLGVSVVLGLDWRGFRKDYKGTAEVGDDIVVRSTLAPRGSLILHPEDRNDWKYVLVRLHGLPELEICGWITGKNGKREGKWEDQVSPFKERPCYLCPAWILRPMTDLILDGSEDGDEGVDEGDDYLAGEIRRQLDLW